MKKTFFLIAASAAMLLHAAPDAAQVFTRTTRYIDMDGNSLFYYNTSELVKLLDKLPGFAGSIAATADVPPESVQLVKDGTSVLLNTLNLNAVKALACSTKELPGDIHIAKNVTYLGNASALPGIFNVAQFKNKFDLNAELSALPSDVIFAIRFQAAVDIVDLEKNINASPNAQLKAYWNMLKSMAATFGADINKLSSGCAGTFTVVIAGNDENSLRMICTVPDENGSLSTLLKRFLPQDPQMPAIYPIPGTSKITALGKPVVLFQDKKVVLMSDYQRCTKKYPKFKPPVALCRQLPVNAGAYTVINVSSGGIAELRKLTAKQPVFAKITAALKPACLIAASVIERDAISDTAASDFSVTDLMYKANLLMYKANSK